MWPPAAIVLAKTGASHWWSRPVSGGKPIARPSSAAGMASRISGPVIDRGDSWIWCSTSGSTWLGPQKVMPMSRNM